MPRLDGMALPEDWRDGCFAARVMTKEGPSAVAVLRGAAFDMTPAFGTVSAWLNEADPIAAIRTRGVPMPIDLPAALEALARQTHSARRRT